MTKPDVMRLRILHISAANSQAGAGMACLNIHSELLKQGVDSKVLFLKNNGFRAEGIFYFDDTLFKRLIQKVTTFLDRSLLFFYPRKKNAIFSSNFFGVRILKHELIKQADIIHLHWINHGFISLNSLSKIAKPVVFTMHDNWLFTGGCHHFFNCRRFEDSCGLCPALNSNQSLDLSQNVLKHKKRIFSEFNFEVVAISQWMKKMAKSSSLFYHKDIHVISSAIDIDSFYLKKRDECRKEFGLSVDDTIVLIGAQEINSPYKGIGLALEVLEEYSDSRLTIVSFGNGEIQIKNSSHHVINLGFISSKSKMASLFSASDLFFAPSLAEGFGMSVAEAQACGTPVLAFKDTGPEDIIEHHVSGYLASYADKDNLSSGLNYCLKNDFDHVRISSNARDKFSIANTALEYKSLYAKIGNKCL